MKTQMKGDNQMIVRNVRVLRSTTLWLLGLLWWSRPWLTVCSGCLRWRPKENKDESAWMYPYTDFPPQTPRISHGLCEACHTRLYGDMGKKAAALRD